MPAPAMAGLVIGTLFILPFLLFSATSGQLFDKTRMIRFVKNLEIGIMLVAAYGFLAHDVVVLLACVFLMGLHSTLFGPVKFALLPQVLNERELTGGNGMVEMGSIIPSPEPSTEASRDTVPRLLVRFLAPCSRINSVTLLSRTCAI